MSYGSTNMVYVAGHGRRTSTFEPAGHSLNSCLSPCGRDCRPTRAEHAAAQDFVAEVTSLLGLPRRSG